MRAAKQHEFQQKAGDAKERLTARAKELGTSKAREILGGLPYGKQMLAGTDALTKLRGGDPRGALESAVEAVPEGKIGSAIKMAMKLAFAASDAVKRRRRG